MNFILPLFFANGVHLCSQNLDILKGIFRKGSEISESSRQIGERFESWQVSAKAQTQHQITLHGNLWDAEVGDVRYFWDKKGYKSWVESSMRQNFRFSVNEKSVVWSFWFPEDPYTAIYRAPLDTIRATQ